MRRGVKLVAHEMPTVTLTAQEDIAFRALINENAAYCAHHRIAVLLATNQPCNSRCLAVIVGSMGPWIWLEQEEEHVNTTEDHQLHLDCS